MCIRDRPQTARNSSAMPKMHEFLRSASEKPEFPNVETRKLISRRFRQTPCKEKPHENANRQERTSKPRKLAFENRAVSRSAPEAGFSNRTGFPLGAQRQTKGDEVSTFVSRQDGRPRPKNDKIDPENPNVSGQPRRSHTGRFANRRERNLKLTAIQRRKEKGQILISRIWGAFKTVSENDRNSNLPPPS